MARYELNRSELVGANLPLFFLILEFLLSGMFVVVVVVVVYVVPGLVTDLLSTRL